MQAYMGMACQVEYNKKDGYRQLNVRQLGSLRTAACTHLSSTVYEL